MQFRQQMDQIFRTIVSVRIESPDSSAYSATLWERDNWTKLSLLAIWIATFIFLLNILIVFLKIQLIL